MKVFCYAADCQRLLFIHHSIIIINITLSSPSSSSSIVHQFIKIIIRITSFCMSIKITPKRESFSQFESKSPRIMSYHHTTPPPPCRYLGLDSILGFGPSLGLFLVLVASITINLIQISCWRPSGHDSGQTAVSGDQNPILFHA